MDEAILSRLGFFTGVNYMKRDASCGSEVLTLGGAGTTVEHTVDHNLDLPYGFIPFYDVFVDVANDDTIWTGDRIHEFTETSSSGNTPPDPTMKSWVTETTLTIQLINETTPTATGDRRIWWLVYKDYGTQS